MDPMESLVSFSTHDESVDRAESCACHAGQLQAPPSLAACVPTSRLPLAPCPLPLVTRAATAAHRHLELVLKPDVALFAKGLRVVSVGEDGVEREFTYPRHQHVVGHVRGRRSSSYARLHIDDETGLMQGSVALERGETYVCILHLLHS